MKRHISSILCKLVPVLAVFVLTVSATNAQLSPKPADATTTLKNAQKAYNDKDYTQATKLYNDALSKKDNGLTESEKAEVCYNLGNCYYRLKEYPRAILNYQRSLKLQPGNKDAAFNLELTQAKLTDRFESPSEMFFVTWIRNVATSQSADAWGHLALASLLVTLVLFAVYRLFSHKALQKTGFFGSIVLLLVTLAIYSLAAYQQQRVQNEQLFVVMSETPAYSTPSTSAPKTRTLNEGTTLKLADTANDNWIQIEMPDGKTAWINIATVECV